MQACETDSRDRGIGRYSMSLVRALMSELKRGDEVIVAIDLADAKRALELRHELRHRSVRAQVVAYGYPSTPVTDASAVVRRLAGQLRSRFYASLHADVLLVSSLFETAARFTTELDWQSIGSMPVATIGYDVIPLLFPERYLSEGRFATEWYRRRLEDLAKFDLILSISQATKRDLVSNLAIADDKLAVIGAGFDATLACTCDDEEVKRRLRLLGIEKPFVLMVGNGDWRKNTIGALQAFAALPKAVRDAHELVLTQVGNDFEEMLKSKYHAVQHQVRILGRVDDATLALLYRGCRVFYFPSHYEGFGLPVLEAMAFEAPVLSSNAGALPEVVRNSQSLFDPTSPREGATLLARALVDGEFREGLRRGAREHALTFTWERTARQALDALRALVNRKRKCKVWRDDAVWPSDEHIALMADACIESGKRGERALEDGLHAIVRGARRRVLVDVTEVVRLDARSGIQRVTRNFFTGLAAIAGSDGSFDVEPFCWTEGGIRYAREYARDHLNVSCAGMDEPVRVEPSDLVFMLDSSWWSPERFDDLHARVHAAGGEVVWVVYDLIPVRFPETCDPGMPPAFQAWLTHAVRTSDGVVCISNATRHDLEAFMDTIVDEGALRPWTRTVYLGCDLDPRAPQAAPSERSRLVCAALGARPYFMALGTLEPRKGYDTILGAFELLWSRGLDIALVIVGKQGWNVAELAARIYQHPEYGRRLFWLQRLGDADMRDLLEHSKGLIQASIWEGFGLPLVEAGSMGVPLLATDIAVFHEIAGDAAAYFPVGDANALANLVAATVDGKLPHGSAAQVCYRSWLQASQELAAELLSVSHAGGVAQNAYVAPPLTRGVPQSRENA
ncbi:MAG: glycosyltransferase family 1 protein [Rhodanobacteraceae bacterium]|nr:MAG: glycosyltransferase family 1 protein [Rhodanobacteraceae bacterium]